MKEIFVIKHALSVTMRSPQRSAELHTRLFCHLLEELGLCDAFHEDWLLLKLRWLDMSRAEAQHFQPSLAALPLGGMFLVVGFDTYYDLTQMR